MPNRIIKESICTSGNLNDLSPEEEIFFYRLLVTCDDYGRFDARPQILRGRCFPLKLDQITDTDISKWLKSLVDHKLVLVYSVNGSGQFLQVITWENHQQIRAKRSKYPAPDSTCNQMIANDSICPRNPIQSESNPNPNPNPISKTAEVFKTFEDNFQKITANTTNRINDLIDEYGEDKVLFALNESIKYNKRNFAYIEKILKNQQDGITKENPEIQKYEMKE